MPRNGLRSEVAIPVIVALFFLLMTLGSYYLGLKMAEPEVIKREVIVRDTIKPPVITIRDTVRVQTTRTVIGSDSLKNERLLLQVDSLKAELLANGSERYRDFEAVTDRGDTVRVTLAELAGEIRNIEVHSAPIEYMKAVEISERDCGISFFEKVGLVCSGLVAGGLIGWAAGQ